MVVAESLQSGSLLIVVVSDATFELMLGVVACEELESSVKLSMGCNLEGTYSTTRRLLQICRIRLTLLPH
jgi:hypothetical protein